MYLSFIIPAHNEEANLPATIEACRGAAGAHEFEVIVVDDCSTDRTPTLALALGATVVSVNHHQIAATRNSGARVAHGEILLFVDADTRPSPGLVDSAVRAVEAGAVGGSASLRFDRPIPFYGRILELFFRTLCRVASLATGCFVYVRRDIFEQVGGFDEDYFAAEEWVLSRALKRVGRFVVLRADVETSGRKLRAYTAGELLRTMIAIGRAGLGSRQDVWYGRRPGD